MDGNLVGLVAVIMIFGIPMAAMYTFYHVRKLRTDERMAALARGVNVPMQPELSEAARARRSGILLVTGRTRLHADLRAHRAGRVGCLDRGRFRHHPTWRGSGLLCRFRANPPRLARLRALEGPQFRVANSPDTPVLFAMQGG